jgi:hypothetical protein
VTAGIEGRPTNSQPSPTNLLARHAFLRSAKSSPEHLNLLTKECAAALSLDRLLDAVLELSAESTLPPVMRAATPSLTGRSAVAKARPEGQPSRSLVS